MLRYTKKVLKAHEKPFSGRLLEDIDYDLSPRDERHSKTSSRPAREKDASFNRGLRGFRRCMKGHEL